MPRIPTGYTLIKKTGECRPPNRIQPTTYKHALKIREEIIEKLKTRILWDKRVKQEHKTTTHTGQTVLNYGYITKSTSKNRLTLQMAIAPKDAQKVMSNFKLGKHATLDSLNWRRSTISIWHTGTPNYDAKVIHNRVARTGKPGYCVRSYDTDAKRKLFLKKIKGDPTYKNIRLQVNSGLSYTKHDYYTMRDNYAKQTQDLYEEIEKLKKKRRKVSYQTEKLRPFRTSRRWRY